jgi:hypothetical protein
MILNILTVKLYSLYNTSATSLLADYISDHTIDRSYQLPLLVLVGILALKLLLCCCLLRL